MVPGRGFQRCVAKPRRRRPASAAVPRNRQGDEQGVRLRRWLVECASIRQGVGALSWQGCGGTKRTRSLPQALPSGSSPPSRGLRTEAAALLTWRRFRAGSTGARRRPGATSSRSARRRPPTVERLGGGRVGRAGRTSGVAAEGSRSGWRPLHQPGQLDGGRSRWPVQVRARRSPWAWRAARHGFADHRVVGGCVRPWRACS